MGDNISIVIWSDLKKERKNKYDFLTLDKSYKSAPELFNSMVIDKTKIFSLKGRWKEWSVVWENNCISQLFPVKLEHGTFRCIPNYAWVLSHTCKGGYQLWHSTLHPAKQLWLKTHVNCFFNSWYCIKTKPTCKSGFDWHFLKNMQQIWDIIWMGCFCT